MAIVINVEGFCILKAKVGGHRKEKCPQCKALECFAKEVNAMVIDSICAEIERAPADAPLKPAKMVAMLQELKVDPSEKN